MPSKPPPPPQAAESTPSGVTPRCRCVVARGRSPRVELTFEGEAAVTCRVGASHDADWWLTGRGVPELAVDLHWDGALLWVADRAGHGRLTVDGEPVGARWRGLGGGCRVEFPGGALVMECSRPGVVVEATPLDAPSMPPPVRSDVREVMRPPPLLDAPTRVAPMPALLDEPTRSYRPEVRAQAADRARTIVPPPVPGAVDDLQLPAQSPVPSTKRSSTVEARGSRTPRPRKASTGG